MDLIYNRILILMDDGHRHEKQSHLQMYGSLTPIRFKRDRCKSYFIEWL